MKLPQDTQNCRLLPPVPQLPCNPCTTFSQPPLDGSLCMSEIYEWHARHSPDHPMFQYLGDGGSTITISFKDAMYAMHRGGRLLRTAVEAAQLRSKHPIIAALSLSETISYTLTLLSAERAGFVLFPISPRNSPAAVAHLLTQVRVDLLLVGRDAVMQDLANATFEHLRTSSTNVGIPPTAVMPVFDDLFPTNGGDVELLPPIDSEPEDLSFILHSSGTTAFPKPIRWSRFNTIALARIILYSEVNMTGMRIAIHALPMFHGLGVLQCLWAAFAGIILVCNKPASPPRVCSPSEMLRSAIALDCDALTCTPNFAEAWAKIPEEVEMLKRTRGIVCGGGPLGKETGDFLVANGVSIHHLYGSTECGLITVIMRENGLKDWEYMSFAGPVNTHWISDEGGSGTSMLTLMTSNVSPLAITNCTIDGVEAFNTNDLFTQHPTNPNLWKIYGRADDQIIHSIGEKTNPGPLEALLNLDTHIAHCLMFGRGQFNAGVLVEPKAESKFDPQDTKKLAEFRNIIWPTVQKMNLHAPQHSRIFKEMILVASPNKPFTFTAKGSPQRQAIIAEYAPEIEALYASVEESTQADLPAPRSWDVKQASQFIRNLATGVLGRPLDDTEDLFQHGCDSLQATWIRNSLLHALRATSKVDTRGIPFNFVYDHPTISQLATYIASVACANDEEGKGDTPKPAIDAMHEMVEKYCAKFPVHNPKYETVPVGDTILVTGTTGGLGCAILSQLAEAPEVVKVYALNRAGKQPLEERQRQSLFNRGYDANAILRSPNIVLLEADLARPMLGLSQDLYGEIRDSVTHIIHNAWPVNFNLNLGFFDTSIRGLRNLVNLALESPHAVPPHLLFVSSIGVLRHTKRDERIAEEFVDANVAVGTGYSESKWVGEQILAIASRDTPLSTVSLRVGQIAGSDNGAWNVHEWVPSLIKSSIHLGCVPMFSANVSWMHARTFASAILEARNASTKLSPLHLVHPRPTSWGTLFGPIAKKYDLEHVSFSQWFTKLASNEASTTQEHHGVSFHMSHNGSGATSDMLASNPAVKLLSFFSECNEIVQLMEKESQSCKEAMGLPSLDVTKSTTTAAKETFSETRLRSLGPEDMHRWLGYWEDVGYLPRN